MASQLDALKLYKEFKNTQQKEIHEFISKYCVWAFGKKQQEAMLKRLNMTEEEFAENYYGGFAGGGCIRKDKLEDWYALAKKQIKDLKDRILSDSRFAFQAMLYEFHNYECYYGDYTDALKALSINPEEVAKGGKLYDPYMLAFNAYTKWCEKHC